MFYFINVGFADKRSGIEHAQMQRLALFKKFQKKAQIVTRNFSLNLHDVLKRASLEDRDMVNLFDFFQGTEGMKARSFTIDDLKIKKSLQLLQNDQDEHGYMVRNSQRIIQRIAMRAPEYTQVDVVRTFDQLGKLVKSEWYDTRGFKGLEQLYDGDANVIAEQVFNPDGQVVYQTFHTKNSEDKLQNTLYRIVNYKGQDYSFNGEQAMMRFFLDELNKRNSEKNSFITDRTFELAWSVLNMKTPAYRYMHLHSNHLNDPEKILDATLNYNYEYAIKNLEKWDGVLIPTEQQRDDFVERYGNKTPAFAISVGNVSDEVMNSPHIPIEARKAGNVIMVARLSPEKQQDQVIRAFKQVSKQVSNAHITFWGYANGKEGPRLKKVVKDLHLEDVVTFEDYTADINAVYDDAVLNLLTSRAEGFALALMEAQSHGIPNIAYDVTYGPHDIITDGRNGRLVKLDDVDALAQAIIETLQNSTELQRFSDNSYVDAERYSQDNIWKSWQLLFNKQEEG